MLAACPAGAAFENAGQQAAACALASRAAVSVDRASLQRLLDEPEFSRVRERNANALQVLWEQLWAWLKRFFETDEAATFAKTVPFVVLLLAFSVALAALLRFARFRRREPVLQAAPPDAPRSLKAPPEHLANARALLATAPREAVREALLALLSSLEKRNLARPDRVKTNRELVAELPRRGADAALVRAVAERVEWYDRAFYSLQPVGRDEAAGFLQSVEAIL